MRWFGAMELHETGFGVMGFAVALATALAVAGGCGDGGRSQAGAWGGTVRDSSGVVVVENPSADDEVYDAVRVREVRVIGGPDDVGGPSWGLVADAGIHADTVFVLDGLAQSVAVHGAGGELLRTLGGPGDGPGEFSRFATSLILHGDTVLVADWGRGRLHRFDRDGTFIDAPLLGGSGGRSWWRKGGDGRLYARSLSRYADDDSRWRGDDVVLRASPAGSAPEAALRADTVARFAYDETDLGGPGRPVLPLIVNAPAWDVLEDGALVWTTLSAEEIRIQSDDGTLERIVRFPGWSRRSPAPADEEALLALMGDKLVALGGSRETIDALGAVQPEALPAITSVRAGPYGTFWVQRMGSVADAHPWAVNSPDPPGGWGGGTWDVLDRDGRRLGSVALGSRVRVLRIADDRILGVRWDDLGREEVVVWELSGVSRPTRLRTSDTRGDRRSRP